MLVSVGYDALLRRDLKSKVEYLLNGEKFRKS